MIDVAEFDKVVPTTDRTKDGVAAVVVIDLRIIRKIWIDVVAGENAIVRMALEIGPPSRKIQLGEQTFARPLQVIEEPWQALAQNRVPIQSRQSDIAPTFKEEMAEMVIEKWCRQLICRDIFKNNHTHPASNVRTDHVRKNCTLEICDNADRNRFAGMKVGGRNDGSKRGVLLHQRLGRWQSTGKIRK
ncbi:hypothetical protein A6U86_13050 [Rhizobium sp. AC27/96]|nr:hypothetical protein A6U86_13050 [Rhizobium sp. AC27/96]